MGIPKKKTHSRRWACVYNRQKKPRPKSRSPTPYQNTIDGSSTWEECPGKFHTETTTDDVQRDDNYSSVMGMVSNMENACFPSSSQISSSYSANSDLQEVQEDFVNLKSNFHQVLHEHDGSNLAKKTLLTETIAEHNVQNLETCLTSVIKEHLTPEKKSERNDDIISEKGTHPHNIACVDGAHELHEPQLISPFLGVLDNGNRAKTDEFIRTQTERSISPTMFSFSRHPHDISSLSTIKNYGQLYRNSSRKYGKNKNSTIGQSVQLQSPNIGMSQNSEDHHVQSFSRRMNGNTSFNLNQSSNNEPMDHSQIITDETQSDVQYEVFRESASGNRISESYATSELEQEQDIYPSDSYPVNHVSINSVDHPFPTQLLSPHKGNIQPELAADDELHSESSYDTTNEGNDVKSDHSEFSNRTCLSSENEEKNDIDEDDANYVEARIKDRRICDLTYMFSELHAKFDDHGKDTHNDCQSRLKDLRCYKVYDQGMRTKMFFICTKCKYKDTIWTDPDKPSDKLSLHEGFVCGTLTSGSGYSGGQEVLAAVSVRCMSARIYRRVRESLVSDIGSLCNEEIKAAGTLERELAMKANNTTPEGKPLATVIGDGVWSKRSYKDGRYDALSGVAVLVSALTGLILYMGVRNKYCLVDARAESLGMEPGPHTCYKNWGRDQASTAMEADIILSGFEKSVEMHDLIYDTFIADGDSSTHNSIIHSHPYQRYGVIVRKIGCFNHLLRLLCNKLKLISKMSTLAPLPRGKITKVRDKVFGIGFHMRKYLVKLIQRISEKDITQKEKEDELFKAIVNMTGHFFGDHSLCDSTLEDCDKSEENMIPFLRTVGMLPKIQKTVDSLAENAPSLLMGKTTNPAEAYNSILNKLTGGRRINHSQRESYMLRAQLAVLQYNHQDALSKLCHREQFPAPMVVLQMEAARKAQNIRTAQYRAEKGRKRRRKQGTDKHYGLHCNVPDIPKEIYDKLVEVHFDRLRDRQKRRHEIERETLDQAGSPEWLEYHKTMITASKFGPLSRKKESTSCEKFVESICYPKRLDTAAIRYGLENEATAIMALENELNTEIRRCGLFIDEEIPYLGATPDGLIGADGIVEVKCLALAQECTPQEAVAEIKRYRAMFDKGNIKLMNKNHRYYYQVQGQLHITRKEYCIFAVWTPFGIMHTRVVRDDEFWLTEMKFQLIRFYTDCVLPEIIDGRKPRRMPIRDPEYIMKAIEEKKKSRREREKKEWCC